MPKIYLAIEDMQAGSAVIRYYKKEPDLFGNPDFSINYLGVQELEITDDQFENINFSD